MRFLDQAILHDPNPEYPDYEWGYKCPECDRVSTLMRARHQAMANLRNHLRSHDRGTARGRKPDYMRA